MDCQCRRRVLGFCQWPLHGDGQRVTKGDWASQHGRAGAAVVMDGFEDALVSAGHVSQQG